jgi:hypothetical protein
VTGPPLFADSLFGLRSWGVVADGRGEWLTHAAPAAGCDCGVHAWHPRRSSARDVLATRATVAGIVEAQGPAEVHEDGFRAERARPYALVLTPRGNPNLIRRLAERYDAAIVEVRGPAELLAYCREHRLGLDEEVVAGLLGIGDAETLRRARRRRARGAGLRIAAALALAAVLVVLGLQVAKDPPGERTLYGRTGEIHRP